SWCRAPTRSAWSPPTGRRRTRWRSSWTGARMSTRSTSNWSRRPARAAADPPPSPRGIARAGPPSTAAPRPRGDVADGARPVPRCDHGSMTDPTDGVIVRRVLAGERQLFGRLVSRHQDRMIAYARHMGFDPAEASDLVQDGFVRAF